jgi:phosphatidylserine/phosphatidylglycerophosphate/cardiolipin synthase-like enzyme
MHNKFIVFDNATVWLGTTNVSFTEIGAEYSANNSVFINSAEVAQVYTDEFNQMFEQKRFSIHKESRVIMPSFRFNDGTQLTIYFSPQDNPIETAVVPFIQSAKSTLDVGMFFLTSDLAVNELMRASHRGVEVRIIADAVASRHPSSQVERLRGAGVTVRIENWGGKMHMKTAIADKTNVLMGSMNWSAAGTRSNDENTIVVQNNKRFAGEILEYFDDLWYGLPDSLAYPRPEGPESINSCFDGLDNNHNGLIDARDPNCRVFYPN